MLAGMTKATRQHLLGTQHLHLYYIFSLEQRGLFNKLYYPMRSGANPLGTQGGLHLVRVRVEIAFQAVVKRVLPGCVVSWSLGSSHRARVAVVTELHDPLLFVFQCGSDVYNIKKPDGSKCHQVVRCTNNEDDRCR